MVVVCRHSERVIDEVAVEGLVVVGVARELRPDLTLVEMHV